MPKYLTSEEAVAAATEDARVNGPIEYEGQNCEDLGRECEGWDGMSHRCECCNQRVCWSTFGSVEDGFTAFAHTH
jgi:hypothetical protein